MCESTAKGCKLQFLFREVECSGGTRTYIQEQALREAPMAHLLLIRPSSQ